MRMSQQTKITWLFIGALLLGGVCSVLTRTDNLLFGSVMFAANFLIYAGLVLYWMQSVHTRLLPTKARFCIMSAAVLMLFYLALRVFKYRIAGSDVILLRYAVYAYWIPQIIIPTLFLMTCIRIRRGERDKGRFNEQLLLIPALALALTVMTNDLHSIVYSPKVDLGEFSLRTGTYSLGIAFYLLYAWMILTAGTGLFLLFRETRKRPAGAALTLLMIIAVWVALLLLRILVFDRYNLPGMYQVPEIHIFFMLGVIELCIRQRLIPYNENYTGFFEQLDLPVMITDQRFEPVYRTDVPITADPGQLGASLAAPIYLNEDTRLSGMRIQAGYAFWTEDESELHKENRRLVQANELLSEENDLIAVENRLKEKQAHLNAQNQVYDRIAQELYPKQKRVEALLENSRPDTPAFRTALAECCVLNAYSKRKTNLLFLSEDTLPKRNRELFLALQETARFLNCCGVKAAAVGEEYSELPLSAIHDLYDTFEEVIEAYLPCMKRMTVSLYEDGVRIAVEAAYAPALPPTKLPVERKDSDDNTFLTIRSKAGGEA